MHVSIVRDFFSEFSRLKLFLLVFVFSLLAILFSIWKGGLTVTAAIVVPSIIAILQITKAVWTPEGASKSKIGLTSLGVGLAAFSTYPLWRTASNSLLEPVFAQYPFLKEHLPKDTPSVIGLIFLLLVILVVNYFSQDRTVMTPHPTPLDKEFPERQYKQYLRDFCGVLLDDLNRIDRETNWSAEVFTPLDAEVEVRSGKYRLKKITDLLRAIRSDRASRVFLVLGDPGSGKSVALRKLCRDLLREIEATGRVPLYVNLREWEPDQRWTEECPPTVEELFDFILTNLKSRGDVLASEFLDKYFKRMFEYGRLFVVLDSFDEIPAVLDVDEKSWLIDKLSNVVYTFLAGAHSSRGVLASRIFRRPTQAFDAKTILEIKPFTDLKIVETLRKSLFYDESLITLLFKSRQEFIPIARNPFTAALISSYAKVHDNTLPETQSELYSNYIEGRLSACDEKIKELGLTKERVIETAIGIADVMLSTENFGLEASVNDLVTRLPDEPIAQVVEILRYGRLGRLGAGQEHRFSFVHRRFNEYFVVQKIKRQPERAPVKDIPTDSRWRDALVLYCEIAEEEHAKQIAEYCWSQIKPLSGAALDDTKYLRGVHCLRFLKEAFRARLECIASFREELAKYIKQQIAGRGNLLSQKLAVEAVGLLQPHDIDRVLLMTLGQGNAWLGEVSLKSCHYLPQLSRALSTSLMLFIERLPPSVFLKRQRELLFSFSLSGAFSRVRRFCWLKTSDLGFLIAGSLFLSTFQFPFLLIFSFLCFGIVNLLWQIMSPRSLVAARFVLGLTVVGPAALLLDPTFRPLAFWPPNVLIISIGVFGMVPLYLLISFWHEVITALKEMRFLRADLKSVLPRFSTILGGVVSLGFTLLFGRYIPERVLLIVLILFMAALSVGILVSLGAMLKKFMTDYQKLQSGGNIIIASRSQIAEGFYGFKTGFFRKRFVKTLDQRGFKPTGHWPARGLPNRKNDEASTLLAQLEERWLGLDR